MNIPSNLNWNLEATISTDQFCTTNSDLQRDVVKAVGTFQLALVGVGIFQVNSVRILERIIPTDPLCTINSD